MRQSKLGSGTQLFRSHALTLGIINEANEANTAFQIAEANWKSDGNQIEYSASFFERSKNAPF